MMIWNIHGLKFVIKIIRNWSQIERLSEYPSVLLLWIKRYFQDWNIILLYF